jgi:hypothetical protein
MCCLLVGRVKHLSTFIHVLLIQKRINYFHYYISIYTIVCGCGIWWQMTFCDLENVRSHFLIVLFLSVKLRGAITVQNSQLSSVIFNFFNSKVYIISYGMSVLSLFLIFFFFLDPIPFFMLLLGQLMNCSLYCSTVLV